MLGAFGKSGVVWIASAGIGAIVLPIAAYFGFQKYGGSDHGVVSIPENAAFQNGINPTGESSPDQGTTSSAGAKSGQGPDVPSFDLVRVDPDGESVIAGTAAPGAVVAIMLNNQKIEQVTADSSGNFVAMLSLPNSDDAQVLSLSVENSKGEVMASTDSVILAPAPKSDVVAANTETGSNASPNQLGSSAEPKSAPAVVLAGKDGVKVLQPAASSLATSNNVVIDAISYDDLGQVQLAGRSKATDQAGHVRVYLDNFPILTAQIGADGTWQTDLPDIDSGVYTLRIDQVNADGDVISRTQTPFKRVTQKPRVNTDGTRPAVRSIIVQPGSTLWAIARENYGSGFLYVRVFEANRDHIRNPHLIYPGQVFEVPQ